MRHGHRWNRLVALAVGVLGSGPAWSADPVVENVVDGSGHVVLVRETLATDDGGQWVKESSVDGLGQVTGTVRLRYDAQSRLTVVYDQTGAATTYQYDGTGRIAQVHLRGQQVTAIGYDGTGAVNRVDGASTSVGGWAGPSQGIPEWHGRALVIPTTPEQVLIPDPLAP